MRSGSPVALLVSIIGHAGAVMMTLLAWETRSENSARAAVIVPVEIVAVAEESNVRALSEMIEEQPPTPAAAAEQQQVAAAAPTPTPAPTRPRPPQQRDDFNLDEIAAGLGNVDARPTPRRNDGAQANRNQQGVGLGTEERVSIEARIRAITQRHLARCWRMPSDLPNPDQLDVEIGFEFDRNGRLRGQPRVISPSPGSYAFNAPLRTAVENAERAVRQCDPYPFPADPIVGEHYELWRSGSFVFKVD